MERLNLTRLKEGTLESLKKKATKAKCTFFNGESNVADYAHKILEQHAGTHKSK